MKSVIAITMGDPAGIGPEIIVKALTQERVFDLCRPIVIGDRRIMERAGKAVSSSPEIICLESIERAEIASSRRGCIALLDLQNADPSLCPSGLPSAVSGRAAVEYVTRAVNLAGEKKIHALVTAPINKEALRAAGLPYPGHTELLAELTGTKDCGMMLVGGPLRVMFATTHLALKNLFSHLTMEAVAKAIHLASHAMQNHFNIPRPRIGVAGLNPHAGEGGLFGREEREIILPAILSARREGMEVSDPLPPDTLFVKAARGAFDVVVAMFHDQGMIPVKLLSFGQAVNITVGLPFIRTSVDHGTACDIAGTGVADPGSLIEAITLAARLASKRSSAPQRAPWKGQRRRPEQEGREGRPKKFLGQHFLIAPSVVNKILKAAELDPQDTVLEIGPGRGILTEALAPRCKRLIALEVDPHLHTRLQERFSPLPHVTLLCRDALTYPYEEIPGPFKVVANLPYYIATPLLFTLLEVRQMIPLMVLMLQKEVAERMIAAPGGKDYGLLSIAVQLHTDAALITRVPQTAFFPRPKVDSAVVALRTLTEPRIMGVDEAFFKKLVKAAFSKRRKTLFNALRSSGYKDDRLREAFLRTRIDPGRRAETLSLSEFGSLSAALLEMPPFSDTIGGQDVPE